MASGKTLYVGPFAHCKNLTELDICSNGMIGVGEDGKIAFVQRDVADSQSSAPEGWEQAKVVRLSGHGFFFPGFIGAWSVRSTWQA